MHLHTALIFMIWLLKLLNFYWRSKSYKLCTFGHRDGIHIGIVCYSLWNTDIVSAADRRFVCSPGGSSHSGQIAVTWEIISLSNLDLVSLPSAECIMGHLFFMFSCVIPCRKKTRLNNATPCLSSYSPCSSVCVVQNAGLGSWSGRTGATRWRRRCAWWGAAWTQLLESNKAEGWGSSSGSPGTGKSGGTDAQPALSHSGTQCPVTPTGRAGSWSGRGQSRPGRGQSSSAPSAERAASRRLYSFHDTYPSDSWRRLTGVDCVLRSWVPLRFADRGSVFGWGTRRCVWSCNWCRPKESQNQTAQRELSWWPPERRTDDAWASP